MLRILWKRKCQGNFQAVNLKSRIKKLKSSELSAKYEFSRTQKTESILIKCSMLSWQCGKIGDFLFIPFLLLLLLLLDRNLLLLRQNLYGNIKMYMLTARWNAFFLVSEIHNQLALSPISIYSNAEIIYCRWNVYFRTVIIYLWHCIHFFAPASLKERIKKCAKYFSYTLLKWCDVLGNISYLFCE